MSLRSSFFFILSVLLLFTGCRQSDKGTREFPAGNEIVTAERLSIEKKKDYTLLRIYNPWQGINNIAMEYYLVNRGAEIPGDIDSSKVIIVPVRSIVCMSVTHAAMIAALGCESSISGISGAGLAWSPGLRRMIDDGKIPDVGYDSGINTELIMKLAPDVLINYGIGSESAAYVNKIQDSGIRVIYDADYLEETPCGKAEWIKLFGALLCREEKADSIFISEAASYDSIAKYVKEHSGTRPSVLLGLPYQDTWYISPGNSYISRLISDAGGRYLWEETRSQRSMPFGIENVYMRASRADVWLNPGIASSKGDIKAVDQRLADIPCFVKGNIYNNTRRMSMSGGNDYWESGSVHPSILLRDLAIILHPENFTDTALVFYRKLE